MPNAVITACTTLTISLLLLGGCGQMGPLTLPGENETAETAETPAQSTAPAAPSN